MNSVVAKYSILACLIICAPALAADVSIKPGDQVVQVTVRDEKQLQDLLDMDLDIWSHEFGVGPIDVHVSTDERLKLDAAGLTYTVANPDLFRSHAEFEAANRLARGLGTPFDSYLPLANIWQFFTNLANARPDLCQELPAMGLSVELRPLRVWRISGPNPGPKPGVFYHGLIHAREWITGPTVMYLANHLVTNYDTDPCIADLVNRTEFFLSPCVNPDGYEYTWTTSRLWRKSRKNNGDGTFGVDLNRNFTYQWGAIPGGGSSGLTNDETYRGPSPGSEPETQAIMNFIISHPNVKAYMDYHSYSQLLMWPWGYTPTLCPDNARYAVLGNSMQQLITAVHGTYYEPGPVNTTIYQANGVSIDYAYGDQGRFAFTIELRPASANPGFELPPDQIIPNCQENLPGILYLSQWASAGILIDLPAGAPTTVLADQPTAINVRITDAQETYAAGSGQMYYRFGTSGPFSATALTSIGGSDYTATLPAGSCGQTAQFYFTAQGSGGTPASSPCNPPANLYSASVTQITTAFTDNFQTDTGWTNTIEGASSGQWQRGVPVNDPNWAYDPPADSDGSGQCYLTQNVAGNTDVDGGTVRLLSPTIDLSAGGYTVSYDYYLYLTVADGVDRLLVEADDNGGAGPWRQIALHTTNGSTSWRHVDIDPATLSAAGLAFTATMKFRFSANDSGTASIVEAGVDAFNITKSGCLCALPGDLNNDTLVDAADIQGFVDAMTNSPFYATCADLAAPSGALDSADVDALVNLLLGL